MIVALLTTSTSRVPFLKRRQSLQGPFRDSPQVLGTIGLDNLTYTLNETTPTITGNGRVIGQCTSQYQKDVSHVIIAEPITAVGVFSFYRFAPWTDVEFPKTPLVSASLLFKSITNLKLISFPIPLRRSAAMLLPMRSPRRFHWISFADACSRLATRFSELC
jgi:hypothetical protein